jgi:homoserine kinase type II
MAVFTDLLDEDRDTIALSFGLGPLSSVIGIADGDRESTFMFRSARGKFIVTLFESGAEQCDLERAFQTMEQLGAVGVPCPTPIRTQLGAATIDLKGKLVAVVSFLEGSPIAAPGALACGDLGKRTGEIHRTLLGQDTAAAGLPRGPIHGALSRDNVFFLNDRVSGIINFRLRHEDILAAELASVLYEWTAKPQGGLDVELAEALIGGYQAVRSLTDDEWRALPALVLSASARRNVAGSPSAALLEAEVIVRSTRLLCESFGMSYLR